MALVLPYHTSHHDSLPIPVLALEGATSYWAAPWPTRRGTCPILVLRARRGAMVAPSKPARLISLQLGRPDVLEGTGVRDRKRYFRACIPAEVEQRGLDCEAGQHRG